MTAYKRAYAVAVYLNKPYQDFTHLTKLSQCNFIECLNSQLLFFKILFWARTTISIPAKSFWCRRKLSLTSLFMRLRCTARRKRFLEIARPSLGMFLALSRASTRKLLSTDRYAELKTLLYSDALVSLSDLGNPVA